MTPITFRQADKEDLGAVQSLVDLLFSNGRRVLHLCPCIASTWDEFQNHPGKGQIIVFESQEQVIGYAILVFFWSNEYGNNIIEIDELCVAESYRSSGIATRFFAWVADTFACQSAGLSLQVAHTNEGAARLYERLGFKPSPNQHLLKIYQSATKQDKVLA